MSRPRNQVPGSAVCTWLTADEHDRVIAIATQRETSVSGVLRLAVVSLLENLPPTTQAQ